MMSQPQPAKSRPALLFAVLFVSGALTGAARAESPTPSASQIQERIRHGQAQIDVEMKGRLQTSRPKKKVNFTMGMKGGDIRFAFDSGEVLHIQRQAGKTIVTRTVNGKASEVSPGAFGDRVGGTDATYEDLAMRFLDWNTATVAGAKQVKGMDTWHLDIPSPTDLTVRSPYSRVYAYADQDSGALLRVDAFDWEGRATKTYEVVSGQKIDGLWFVKKMKIQTLDPETGKEASSTTLYFVPQERS